MPGAGPGNCREQGAGSGPPQNGRVANEDCHHDMGNTEATWRASCELASPPGTGSTAEGSVAGRSAGRQPDGLLGNADDVVHVAVHR